MSASVRCTKSEQLAVVSLPVDGEGYVCHVFYRGALIVSVPGHSGDWNEQGDLVFGQHWSCAARAIRLTYGDSYTPRRAVNLHKDNAGSMDPKGFQVEYEEEEEEEEESE
jgi:hypothetical protein